MQQLCFKMKTKPSFIYCSDGNTSKLETFDKQSALMQNKCSTRPLHPTLCTLCLKKTVQNCFCHNFVNFPPILIIFGRKMAKRLKLYNMHSFSTSHNSRHHTTVLNANVPNCYTTLKVVICNKLSNDLINTE